MRIIEKVEINYFRSIYSARLADLRDLNVLVGGNDRGKSNFLRALNLFFNNQTDLYTKFNFLDDLTEGRADEARSAKGRATIWIKVTFNNFLGWRSLPRKFVVKKSWNRYSDQPEISFPGYSDIPLSTLGRFQNAISFHYVPAVRGRDIYAHYLSQLYDLLTSEQDVDLSAASNELAVAINAATLDMTDQIKEHLGFESTIKPPADLRVLFESLDFSTKFSSYDIPLQRRGDGIQGRHIPFILHFMASRSKKYHIWAYEEPENSLELGQAFDMADHFAGALCEQSQIFVTTHSPAFYDLAGDNLRRFSVTSEPTDDFHNVTRVDDISDHSEIDVSLGLAGLIAARTRNLHDEIKAAKDESERLERELSEVARPKIIVEGITDASHLELAYTKLFARQCPWTISPGSNAESVLQFCLSQHRVKAGGPPIIGLVDFDSEGRNVLAKAKRFRSDSEFRRLLVIDSESRIYLGALILPNHFAQVSSGIGEDNLQLCIEFMYPPPVMNEAIEDGALSLSDWVQTVNSGMFRDEINFTERLASKLPDELTPYIAKVDDECKGRFVEWLQTRDPADFEPFRPMFELIEGVISRDRSGLTSSHVLV